MDKNGIIPIAYSLETMGIPVVVAEFKQQRKCKDTATSQPNSNSTSQTPINSTNLQPNNHKDTKGTQYYLLLVDTGADISILNKPAFDYFKPNNSHPIQRSIVTATGMSDKAESGKFCFTIEDTEYVESFVGVDCSVGFDKIKSDTGHQLHGILGCDFLLKHHWIIDFKQQIIRLN